MTKVCHLSSAHAPNDTRIFHKQCASLAKAGYQVSFVVKAKDAQSVGCTTQKGVQVIQVPVDSSSRFKRMLFGAKAVYQKALEVDADIYEFHDPELLPYGLKLAKKGKKVIFDSHEDYPTQIMEKEWIPAFLRRMISSAYRAQRAVRRSIKSAPSSPTRSTSHECQVSAPYMGRSSSGTSSSFQYGQCSQAFSPPAVEMHRSALTISSFFMFILLSVPL